MEKKIFPQNAVHRKADVHHKIQLGGLVVRSGALERLGVPPAADMQRHFGREAAIILGVLAEAVEEKLGKADAATLDRLAQLGKSRMSVRSS